MKKRLCSLFVFLIVTSLVSSGCAIAHHGAFGFIRPENNQVFATTDQINVTLRRYADVSPYNSFAYEIMDNGRLFAHDVLGGSVREVQSQVPTVVVVVGPHAIQAHAQGYNDANHHGEWYEMAVCIYIGANPPPTFTCLHYSWPVHLEYSTPDPLSILPTLTPDPYNIIRPPSNPNTGGSGDDPGSVPVPSCPAGETYTCDPVCGCAPP